MNVLITGGTGTLGRAVVRKLLGLGQVEKIVIYSRDEVGQTMMASESEFKSNKVLYVCGSVTDKEALYRTFSKEKIDGVVHAAAIKHVPIAERQPSECIEVNVVGSRNVLQAAAETKVKKVVLVSTDKAAKPSNVYGMTKALMERLTWEYDGVNDLQVVSTRFGNLVGSRGSVLELFTNQIRAQGRVTVTDPNMTRFFIRIKQAADVVNYALLKPVRRGILVPHMKAATLSDFVKAIFEHLHASPSIDKIGARPGEKKHEAIITEDEIRRAETAPEFEGVIIREKDIDEKRRALSSEVSSDTSPKMDSDELVGMLRELSAAKNVVRI